MKVYSLLLLQTASSCHSVIKRRAPLVPTHDGELGAGDVRPADHPVVALVGCLALLDPEQVAVAADADVILVAAAQFLGALVPGQSDLWVVDLDLALKHRLLVDEDGLIGDVCHHGDGLHENTAETL